MNKGNLLIVDDEPILLKMLKNNLEEFADTIFTATNGQEALDVLDKNEVHCVICDINMPKMNGVEVIKRVRANNNSIPFIFYTGHGSHALMIEAAKYGAFDFLNKPNLDGLEEVITRGLNEGFSKIKSILPTEDAFISEYQKLLGQLEQK